MDNKKSPYGQEITYNFDDEISIHDFIKIIDKSDKYSLYSINEDDDNTGEKNILIKVEKNNKRNYKG